jgi:antitoxin component YwqK of YwqJK toxin-antitoxin module
MKSIVLLLFTICILMGQNVFGQKQNVYYIKSDGSYVSKAESADFIRIVQEPEKGSSLYPTKEYYKSGHKKSYGNSNAIDPPVYEGRFMSFFENGMRKQLKNYVNGKWVDSVVSYFPNGKLHSSVLYKQSGDSSIIFIKEVRDSAGTSMVTDGNGYAVLYDEYFNYISEKGTIKDGKYDGEWTGELRGIDTLRYKEVYAEGKLLSGESIDGKGITYHYTISEVKPNFEGGMEAFYKIIRGKIRYPSNMVAKRIQGIARISFVILANGEISNLHAINDVQPELAAEAIRIIKIPQGWHPGIQKGRTVEVASVIPISFTLGN